MNIKNRIVFFVKRELSKSSLNNIQNKFLRVVLKVFTIPYLEVLKLFILLLRKKYMIDNFVLVLTVKCSLKCKECQNLMQYYDNPYDFELNVTLQSLEKVFSVIDYLPRLSIIGGEPFLYKDLDKILEFIYTKKSQVGSITIITNGTIVPQNRNLIELLKNKKMKISISDYGKLSKKKDELIEFSKMNRIKYHCNKIRHWTTAGPVVDTKAKENELIQQFAKCKLYCYTFFNGKLHYCPRSAAGMDLKLIPDIHNDYVDFLDDTLTKEDLRHQLDALLYNRKYIETCRYCLLSTPKAIQIPVAEQMIH